MKTFKFLFDSEHSQRRIEDASAAMILNAWPSTTAFSIGLVHHHKQQRKQTYPGKQQNVVVV